MSRDNPRKALLVVALTAIICSTLVAAAVVILRPIQLNNQLLERSRNIMQLTGLLAEDEAPDSKEMLALFKSVDARIVEISEGRFNDSIDVRTFNQRRAANDPELGVAIPPELDLARLGRRSRFAPVYMVWDDEQLDRIILPVHGTGAWSMLFGYIAIEADLRTIAGMIFYEQNETPGIGDQITHAHWLEQWRGRRLFNDQGETVFRVSVDRVRPGSEAARYEVDALSGATITTNAVTNLIRYWFGPHGFAPFFDYLRENPPEPPEEDA